MLEYDFVASLEELDGIGLIYLIGVLFNEEGHIAIGGDCIVVDGCETAIGLFELEDGCVEGLFNILERDNVLHLLLL